MPAWPPIRTRGSPKYLEMVQAMGQIGSTFGAKSAFIEPELLKMGKAKLDAFLRGEPKLAVYRQNIDDVLRRQKPTRDRARKWRRSSPTRA